MIELRPLRQLVAVAEELHFGRAARRLHMTQPPLTQAVQALERRLELQLLVRNRRSVALTPAGTALLEQARRLLQAAEALPAAVRAAAAGRLGVLRLAFVSSIAYGPLPEWLRAFREAQPEVDVQLREATLDVQLAAFAADEIDAGFALHAPDAAPPGFGARTVLTEPMHLVLPAAHPLARRRALRLADVAGLPLVIFPRTIAPSLFDAIVSAYRAAGHTPHVAQEAIQMQTIVNLVSAGIGVAWVPQSLQQLQRPGVVHRPVQGAALSAQTSLLWAEPAQPVVRRFVDHVQAMVEAAQPGAPQASGRRRRAAR